MTRLTYVGLDRNDSCDRDLRLAVVTAHLSLFELPPCFGWFVNSFSARGSG
jgi:hypothetical protein